MHRRELIMAAFLIGPGVTMSSRSVVATDVERLRSSFMTMLDSYVPDRSGEKIDTFRVTRFMDRELADESPIPAEHSHDTRDSYEASWSALMGFPRGSVARQVRQNDATGHLWVMQMPLEDIDRASIMEVWESNGYAAQDSDWSIWSIDRRNDGRSSLSDRVADPQVVQEMTDGWYDHLTFIDDVTIMATSDRQLADLAHQVDRRKVMGMYFANGVHNLRDLVPVGTYEAALAPGNRIMSTTAMGPVIDGLLVGTAVPVVDADPPDVFQAACVELSEHEEVERYIDLVYAQLSTLESSAVGYPYGEFLAITGVHRAHHVAVRFDISVKADVDFRLTDALTQDDLTFLTP